MERPNEAVKILEQLVKNPRAKIENGELFILLSLCYSRVGNQGKAFLATSAAIMIEPRSQPAWDMIKKFSSTDMNIAPINDFITIPLNWELFKEILGCVFKS